MSDTIFHKIMRREIPSEIIFEDDQVIVIRDINPVAPTHLLIIPKKTIASVREVAMEDRNLIGHLLWVAGELARRLGFSESGYRVVVNTGEDACQTVHQLHVHLLAGRTFVWPPG